LARNHYTRQQGGELFTQATAMFHGLDCNRGRGPKKRKCTYQINNDDTVATVG
jgi:hypothetical protein